MGILVASAGVACTERKCEELLFIHHCMHFRTLISRWQSSDHADLSVVHDSIMKVLSYMIERLEGTLFPLEWP